MRERRERERERERVRERGRKMERVKTRVQGMCANRIKDKRAEEQKKTIQVEGAKMKANWGSDGGSEFERERMWLQIVRVEESDVTEKAFPFRLNSL
jgi:hypothetical protein